MSAARHDVDVPAGHADLAHERGFDLVPQAAGACLWRRDVRPGTRAVIDPFTVATQ